MAKDTQHWAELFQQWWDKKGSKQKRPVYPKDLKEGYRKAAILELENNKSPTPLTFNEGREAFIETRGPGQGLKVVYQDTRDVKGNTRRAQTKNKTISVQERIDWYKRNLYPNPTQRGIADFKRDQQKRAETKAKARSLTKQGVPSIYEHLSPLNVDEKVAGGFESARNTVVAPAKENAFKSDKVASLEVLREQGVPTTRSSAIRADAHNTPLPGTDKSRFDAVYGDIVKNKRPKASTLKRTSKLLGIPLITGVVAAGIDLASGGNAASAAGAFVDAENPIDGGALGHGTMDEPQRVAQRYQQLEAERESVKRLTSSLGNIMRDYFLR